MWWLPLSLDEYKEFQRQHGLEDHKVGPEHGLLPLRPDGCDFDVPLKIRPGVLEFLKAVVLSKKYETYLWTRGKRHGITPNAIDALTRAVAESAGVKNLKASDLFSGQYFDEDCENVMGLGLWWCKPLEKVVRDSRGDAVAKGDLLKRVVIVDDDSNSHYPCNKYNGIPVREFRGIRGKDDTCGGMYEVEYVEDGSGTFERLTELLEKLEPVKDVQPVLKKMFLRAKREYL